jgi:D-arabinono-1,4-lactone oxidase
LNHLTPEDPDYVPHNIPYSADNLYVHAPVEVRVTDTSNSDTPRPHLDPTCLDEPTLYLNATLYRPYHLDPPCRARYYQAFEYLMRDLGGKPHWAKNFESDSKEMEEMYGDRLIEWRKIRNESDPEGMFVGEWHRKFVLGEDQPKLALEESEVSRTKLWSGGVRVTGAVFGEDESQLIRNISEASFVHVEK